MLGNQKVDPEKHSRVIELCLGVVNQTGPKKSKLRPPEPSALATCSIELCTVLILLVLFIEIQGVGTSGRF